MKKGMNMQPLEKSLRTRLEHTIKDARDIAEQAARASLQQLGVGEAAPFAHLSEDDRILRRRLRVHGRQLGDLLGAKGEQEIDRLVEETAYEHWHRMLFARFLAENELLMYWPDGDDEPIDVDLETCQGLLDEGEEQANSVWELAARFAARMLPQIFRMESPVFQLTLPPEHQLQLERLVADLPSEVFTASDSLGWVYQFWQAKKKEEVNKSEVKIGARELPAVTQLFTEPYMVSFLLDNSLGAWWAARRLTEDDLKNAQSEEELRQKASIPGVPLEYLRFVRQEDETWTPAAGTFDGWPDQLGELKTLDPCCGSGHFLVSTFLMLVPMRMERDGLPAQEAVDAVLRENIHGLELDKRCVELAAFALALTAWKYPNAAGYRVLPELNVACSGLSISTRNESWVALAGEDTNLRSALQELYKQFKNAPILGSLINLEASLGKGSYFQIKWEDVGPWLTKALKGKNNDENSEIGVVAHGTTKAAKLLSKKYEFIITNPPYLGRAGHNDILKKYADKYYTSSKNDLANIFFERAVEFCSQNNGYIQFVMPQACLFQSRFKKTRKMLLSKNQLLQITYIGEGGFDSSQASGAFVVLLTARARRTESSEPLYLLDASIEKNILGKQRLMRKGELRFRNHEILKRNPDSIIAFGKVNQDSLLVEFAKGWQGIVSSDNNKFTFFFWEILKRDEDWVWIQWPPEKNLDFNGLNYILKWEKRQGDLHNNSNAHNFPPKSILGKRGIAIQNIRNLCASFYLGDVFGTNITALVPEQRNILPALWAYCTDKTFYDDVREIAPRILVTPGTFGKLKFDLDHWTKVAAENYPYGLPKPYADDPTQRIFHGHPCGSVIWDESTKWTAHAPLRTDDTVLQIVVARLLGYRWPAELDPDMELADEQREWVNKCETLLPHADDDGIVCIPPVRGEASASERLLDLLAAAYGDAWSNDILTQLLANANHAGKSLETWLRDKFFTQHCKLFKHRPFIWQIWDGLNDGFSALVNYHKLDYKNLETLTYTYLGDWITRQKQDIEANIDGAQERLAAAEALKKKLELILKGEKPHDIFVRWKPLAKQPIGWNPDLNDGVRLNIRPFMTVGDIKKKGAGILRDKPNINWNKDRGKDVESAPWYRLGLEYDGKEGDRINDHHLSLAEKQAAREADMQEDQHA
jgi:hypothetical protein